MIYYYFLQRDWGVMMTSLGILTTLGSIVILATLIDLMYGIKESKKRGLYTHSQGLRRTISKTFSYLSFLLIGFFFDAVNPMFIYWKIPVLPLFSIAVSIYLLFTEFFSIREHLSDGQRKKFRDTPEGIRDLLKDIREISSEMKNIKNNFEK